MRLRMRLRLFSGVIGIVVVVLARETNNNVRVLAVAVG